MINQIIIRNLDQQSTNIIGIDYFNRMVITVVVIVNLDQIIIVVIS